jgi:sugar phosphate permease
VWYKPSQHAPCSGQPGEAREKRLIRIRKPFFGWYIAAMSFISLFISQGTQGFAFGIFLPAMSADLGWSRSTIVIASSITSIIAAIAGPILGRVVDKRGPRLVLLASIVVMALGVGGAGLVQEPWQLDLTFGLISGSARSALQSVLPGTMIANWFRRKRSAAYGFAAMGPPVSNFILPPVLAVMVVTYGWRSAWFGMAMIPLVLGFLPALFITRRSREQMGLEFDGEATAPATTALDPASAGTVSNREESWTAREAVHSVAFWMVAAGMALILLAPNVSIIFLYSYLSSRGLEPGPAAAAVSAVSGMQVLSRLFFWAPVSSRVPSVRWLIILWGCILLSATILLALAQGEVWAYIAAAVLGLGLGGNLILQLQVWPEYFGRLAAGTIIGTGQLVQGVTAATVPLALAARLDHTGDYTELYLIVSAFVCAGLGLHLFVGRPQRPVWLSSAT